MSSPAASTTITELKVSAHLMTLDAGLFCVFNSPGAPPPDASTGLPGVRLSAAPGPAGHYGTVSISGFNSSGWLGGNDGAALVRVTGGPAQVLVTVYQDLEGQHDAPKLQVIRLTEGTAETAAEVLAQPSGTPGTMAQDPRQGRKVEVAAHIYGRGDVGGPLGEWLGERGSKRWIEGFGLMPSEEVAASDIEYQAVLGRGWLSPWSEGGQFCGSRGMSLPILGLRVRLRGAAATTHKLSVAASFVDGTEVGPVSDGEACEAPSLSPLEAFQITLQPADETLNRSLPSRAPATKTAASRGLTRSPEPAASSARGRGRAAASAAVPAKSVRKKAASPPAKPAPAATPAEPPVAATPTKPAAKRTPATTRRR